MVTLSSAWRTVRTPMLPSSLSVVEMSLSRGTLVRRTESAVSSPAQRIGSAAFFAPETLISPRSGVPPTIRNLSISRAP